MNFALHLRAPQGALFVSDRAACRPDDRVSWRLTVVKNAVTCGLCKRTHAYREARREEAPVVVGPVVDFSP